MHRKNNELTVRSAFTLVEVVIALVILGIGLVGVIQLFPMGLESSVRAENSTRAAILAQGIMESLKADCNDLPFIPGSREVFDIPGNGFDYERDSQSPNSYALLADRNKNGRLDMDFDGGYVDKIGPDGLPDIRQSVPDYNYYGLTGRFQGDADGDGDPSYDPENFGMYGIDEEFSNGKDDDGDGYIDEDCRLASNYLPNGSLFRYDPIAPGDGMDNDGDGEVGSPTRRILVDTDGDYRTPPQWIDVKYADGEDNNGDGRIDEGIDEEIFDGLDNDGDGLIDEDCRMPSFPFTPRPFPPVIVASAGLEQERFEHPNERFSWQIFVGRISDGGGDGLDNDGDGRIDEDPRDGIDNDRDGRIDEDPSPMPLPGYRKVVVRITWGGDGVNNDGDFYINGKTGAREEIIDEELLNGLDDDLDGRIDEDTFEFFYDLVGFIQIKTRDSSKGY